MAGRSWATRRNSAGRRGLSHPLRVEDARLLERPASLDAELGNALLDGFGRWLLIKLVRDDLVLLAVDVAAETEDHQRAVCVRVPRHPPVSRSRIVGVDEAAIGARVDVRLLLQLGVVGWVDVSYMLRLDWWDRFIYLAEDGQGLCRPSSASWWVSSHRESR